jgi:hypothetical protein
MSSIETTSVRKNPKKDAVTYTLKRGADGALSIETNAISNHGTALAALQSLAVLSKASKCGVCGCTETYLMTSRRPDKKDASYFVRCNNPKCKATLFLFPDADNPSVLQFASGDNVDWSSRISTAPPQQKTKEVKAARTDTAKPTEERNVPPQSAQPEEWHDAPAQSSPQTEQAPVTIDPQQDLDNGGEIDSEIPF